MIITKQEANKYSKKVFSSDEKLKNARRVINLLIERNYQSIKNGKTNIHVDLNLTAGEWTTIKNDYKANGFTINYDKRAFLTVSV